MAGTTPTYDFMTEGSGTYISNKDAQCLLYCAIHLMQACPNERAWVNCPLQLCFEKYGIKKFERDLCILTDSNIASLDYDCPRDGVTKPLPLILQNLIRLALHAFHHFCHKMGKRIRMTTVTREMFDRYRVTNYDQNAKLKVFGSESVSTSLKEFKKSIKRDTSKYLPFKDPKDWKRVYENWKLQNVQNDIEELDDPTFVPDDIELDDSKNKFLFIALDSKITEPQAKADMREAQRKGDYDMRKLLKKFDDRYAKAEVRDIHLQTIEHKIINDKIEDYKGTLTSFVQDFHENASLFNLSCDPQDIFTDGNLMRNLHRAVSDHPELRDIRQTYLNNQRDIPGGKTRIDYDTLRQLILNKTQVIDARNKKKYAPRPRSRNVNKHEWNEVSDEEEDSESEEEESDTLQVNLHDSKPSNGKKPLPLTNNTRLPNELWKKLAPNMQKIWLQLDDPSKRLIMQYCYDEGHKNGKRFKINKHKSKSSVNKTRTVLTHDLFNFMEDADNEDEEDQEESPRQSMTHRIVSKHDSAEAEQEEQKPEEAPKSILKKQEAKKEKKTSDPKAFDATHLAGAANVMRYTKPLKPVGATYQMNNLRVDPEDLDDQDGPKVQFSVKMHRRGAIRDDDSDSGDELPDNYWEIYRQNVQASEGTHVLATVQQQPRSQHAVVQAPQQRTYAQVADNAQQQLTQVTRPAPQAQETYHVHPSLWEQIPRDPQGRLDFRRLQEPQHESQGRMVPYTGSSQQADRLAGTRRTVDQAQLPSPSERSENLDDSRSDSDDDDEDLGNHPMFNSRVAQRMGLVDPPNGLPSEDEGEMDQQEFRTAINESQMWNAEQMQDRDALPYPRPDPMPPGGPPVMRLDEQLRPPQNDLQAGIQLSQQSNADQMLAPLGNIGDPAAFQRQPSTSLDERLQAQQRQLDNFRTANKRPAPRGLRLNEQLHTHRSFTQQALDSLGQVIHGVVDYNADVIAEQLEGAQAAQARAQQLPTPSLTQQEPVQPTEPEPVQDQTQQTSQTEEQLNPNGSDDTVPTTNPPIQQDITLTVPAEGEQTSTAPVQQEETMSPPPVQEGDQDLNITVEVPNATATGEQQDASVTTLTEGSQSFSTQDLETNPSQEEQVQEQPPLEGRQVRTSSSFNGTSNVTGSGEAFQDTTSLPDMSHTLGIKRRIHTRTQGKLEVKVDSSQNPSKHPAVITTAPLDPQAAPFTPRDSQPTPGVPIAASASKKPATPSSAQKFLGLLGCAKQASSDDSNSPASSQKTAKSKSSNKSQQSQGSSQSKRSAHKKKSKKDSRKNDKDFR